MCWWNENLKKSCGWKGCGWLGRAVAGCCGGMSTTNQRVGVTDMVGNNVDDGDGEGD